MQELARDGKGRWQHWERRSPGVEVSPVALHLLLPLLPGCCPDSQRSPRLSPTGMEQEHLWVHVRCVWLRVVP